MKKTFSFLFLLVSGALAIASTQACSKDRCTELKPQCDACASDALLGGACNAIVNAKDSRSCGDAVDSKKFASCGTTTGGTTSGGGGAGSGGSGSGATTSGGGDPSTTSSTSSGMCSVQLGQYPCGSDTDCCDGHCGKKGGTKVCCNDLGGACSGPQDCCGVTNCEAGKCCGVIGESCTQDSDCCASTPKCNNGQCG